MSKIEKKPNVSTTKQSFKDECDINKILARAQKTGTLSHLSKYQAQYGDFADYDFFEHQRMLTRGREIMDELPSEIRSEFHNDPRAFFAYVNDPANVDRLGELLPALAAPGRQLLNVRDRGASAPASEPKASETPPTEGSTEVSPEAPTEASPA